MKLPEPRTSAAHWRSLLLGFLLLLAAALLKLAVAAAGLGGRTAPALLIALLVSASWLLTARFLLPGIRGQRLWTASLFPMLALAMLAGPVGRVLIVLWAVAFLTWRRYRCWRRVSDRRRAVGFGLGVAAILLVALCWGFWKSADGESPAAVRGLGTWALVPLLLFWAWSLFHLAMGMRLHFLRLRPKLAVSAVLIGVVPLLLVVGLGLMILYTGLGGARAARAEAALEGWRRLAAGGVAVAPALFDTAFSWPDPAGGAPAWAPDLAVAFRRALDDKAAGRGRDDDDDDDGDDGDEDGGAPAAGAVPDSVPAAAADEGPWAAPADSTGWFLAGGHIWLVRWQGLDAPQPQLRAWQLGRRPLTELSRQLRAGVFISGSVGRTAQGDLVIGFQDGSAGRKKQSSDLRFSGLEASYRDPAATGPWFPEGLFFGGTFLALSELRDGRLREHGTFLRLRVGAADLKADFIEGESNLNVAIVVGLCVVALLFLIIEGFAVFFGVRISEGIVTGVHALHRGTRAVAAGDLDAVIAIPNEDEFGDLARSFNEMTFAVKHGRELALANERLTQELATARAIQMRLLPGAQPQVPGFEVTGASVPSREIGGDYYDFLAQGDDAIGIAIGDVSGKGMPAALLMSNLQASLHGQVLHRGTVASVVQRVNDLLVRSTDPHMFATFFYGVLETATGRFTCTNAGHNPPLVLRRD
ncbi:HAMP domain-containing protein, partial [bacterium]|nr:HAMP domain-containing protein [bacterium]